MERKPEEYKQPPSHYEEDEIDLIALAKTLWEGRKTIIKTAIIFTCIGLFVALTTPAEYTSTVVVKPILSNPESKIGGSLGGLTAMAGINLGGSGASAEIHPTLFPEIIESYRYKKALLKTPIYSCELNKEVDYTTYYTEVYSPSLLYYIKRYTIGLPGLVIKQFRSVKEGEHFELNLNLETQQDRDLFKLLENQLNLVVDEEAGTVELSCSMLNKVQAAQMVQAAHQLLQREVIAHKLKKVEEDLIFIEDRYLEKKIAFEQAQNNLAKYRDANKNVNTAIALTEIERLESEFQLAFSVYSELAKQVEKQKIQVKENTPVFVVLNEPVIPFEKSNLPSVVIITIWMIVGTVLCFVYIIGGTFLSEIKNKWD